MSDRLFHAISFEPFAISAFSTVAVPFINVSGSVSMPLNLPLSYDAIISSPLCASALTVTTPFSYSISAIVFSPFNGSVPSFSSSTHDFSAASSAF